MGAKVLAQTHAAYAQCLGVESISGFACEELHKDPIQVEVAKHSNEGTR